MSFIFKIDGIDMPAPVTFNWAYEDLHANTGTNARGHVRFNTIRRNRRMITAEFAFLSRSEFSTIMTAIKDKDFFEITAYDSVADAIVTGSFYKGNRTVEFFNSWEGEEAPRHLKVNFIEG